MPETSKTLIMKFGSSVICSPKKFSQIADLVIARREEFEKIVIVVSAMGDMTNQLIFLAEQVHPNPPVREYDMMVSAGERISIALLAMALLGKGVDAQSFTGSQSGIITTQNHSNAKIIDVKPHRIKSALASGQIAIIAGFQGVSTTSEITTLGRGGSDTTAVALALALQAKRVEFYKDVGGLYANDPHTNPKADFYEQLTHCQARTIISQSEHAIIDMRALALAKKNHLPLHICSMHEKEKKTIIEATQQPPTTPVNYETEIPAYSNTLQ